MILEWADTVDIRRTLFYPPMQDKKDPEARSVEKPKTRYAKGE